MAATMDGRRARTLEAAAVRRANTIRAAREEIAQALDAGATLEDVDRSIIGPHRRRMTADARDALWLFAWTELDRRAHRGRTP